MTVRLMRGQIVVRELDNLRSSLLWTPAPGQRDIATHRGIVLAVGPCSPDVPACDLPVAGDVVQYHWEHNEEAFTMPWPGDGLRASWLPQRCVDAVWVAE